MDGGGGMLVIKMTPVPKARVVSGEGLYAVVLSTDRSHYEDLGLKVRAKTALDAERKLLFCFRRELKGKTLDFDPARFTEKEATDEAQD